MTIPSLPNPPISLVPTRFQIMCSSGYVQSISINDIPLHGLGRIEQVWENVLGAPEVLGNPVHVPLRPGMLNLPQIAGGREFGVGMVVHGTNNRDQAGHNTAWRALAKTVWSLRSALSVKRTVRYTTGDETHVCAAKYISGLDPNMVVPGALSRVALRFTNLDGYWYSPTEITYQITSTPAAITVLGDIETTRIMVTLEGSGGPQLLTNTTNGTMLHYSASTSGSPANLDVMAFTASQGGVNTVGNVTHSGDIFWLRLQPGVNTLSLTGGGTATLQVRAAYL